MSTPEEIPLRDIGKTTLARFAARLAGKGVRTMVPAERGSERGPRFSRQALLSSVSDSFESVPPWSWRREILRDVWSTKVWWLLLGVIIGLSAALFSRGCAGMLYFLFGYSSIMHVVFISVCFAADETVRRQKETFEKSYDSAKQSPLRRMSADALVCLPAGRLTICQATRYDACLLRGWRGRHRSEEYAVKKISFSKAVELLCPGLKVPEVCHSVDWFITKE